MTLSCPIIAMGDYNADLLVPFAPNASHLLKAFSIANILVHSVFPTRFRDNSASYLDLIACSSELVVVEYYALSRGFSDHLPVQATVKASFDIELQPIFRRNYKNIDFVDLHYWLRTIQLNYSDNNPDDLLNSKFMVCCSYDHS